MNKSDENGYFISYWYNSDSSKKIIVNIVNAQFNRMYTRIKSILEKIQLSR